jgi:hypothetical protein
MAKHSKPKPGREAAVVQSVPVGSYDAVLQDVVGLLEVARRTSARAVNTVMTTTYWLVGRRIVEHEQGGESRAGYAQMLIESLASDLTSRFGRGFSRRNLEQMRLFYLHWPIAQTPSAQLENGHRTLAAPAFPLPWSHYTELIRSRSPQSREFYETEAPISADASARKRLGRGSGKDTTPPFRSKPIPSQKKAVD